MAQIHAAGQTGGRSPGLDAAIAAYLDENPPAGGGGASALNDLTDVDTTGQTTGDVLKYNGTSWVADDAASAGTVTLPTVSETTGRALVLTDSGAVVEFTSATPVDVTIPLDSSVAFPVGTVVNVCQMGAGQVTLVPDSGVTLNSRGGLTSLAGQYAEVSVRKRDTDSWLLVGDLA